MVAGRGVAQLITSGQIVTFDSPALSFLGSGTLLLLPTPVIIVLVMLALVWGLTRGTALGMFIEAAGINIRAASVFCFLKRRFPLTTRCMTRCRYWRGGFPAVGD